jgi:hypothetical protein
MWIDTLNLKFEVSKWTLNYLPRDTTSVFEAFNISQILNFKFQISNLISQIDSILTTKNQ